MTALNNDIKRVVIFGNSSSGKSTLAKKRAANENLAHLDLDTIAWQAGVTPPQRSSLDDSNQLIQQFISKNKSWVIEGCYADILELVLPVANELIFLDLPIIKCIEHAKQRGWEPHKYKSMQAQQENLAMLIEWIKQYEDRDDALSRQAHMMLYNNFCGKKVRLHNLS